MPKDDDLTASSNGASANGAVDADERAFLDSVHAGYRQLRKELKAEGVDGTAEYEKLLADFGIAST